MEPQELAEELENAVTQEHGHEQLEGPMSESALILYPL